MGVCLRASAARVAANKPTDNIAGKGKSEERGSSCNGKREMRARRVARSNGPPSSAWEARAIDARARTALL